MNGAPILFDRALARARLTRALASPRPGADFLIERAAAELGERLAAVRRRFERVADIGTPTCHAAEVLAARAQGAIVLRMAPVAASAKGRDWLGFVGDEEQLALAPGSIDLIVSLMALHAVNDVPGALVQIRRALRPDGLFLGCLAGGATLSELRQSLIAAESEREAGASVHVAPFADVRDTGALLQRAGFVLPVVDVDDVVVRYRDPLALMHDLRAMGASNVLFERRRTPMRRSTLRRALEIYGERFADADGRLRATFELIWMCGWAPLENAGPPSRPGSAKPWSRLARQRPDFQPRGGDTRDGETS